MTASDSEAGMTESDGKCGMIESGSGDGMTELKSEVDYVVEMLKKMESRIVGQSDALNVICTAMKPFSPSISYDSDYSEDDDSDYGQKKAPNFLFCGPEGVGKSETAKVLAAQTQKAFLRLDMSQFQKEHHLSKLIGSPPGSHSSYSLIISQIQCNCIQCPHHGIHGNHGLTFDVLASKPWRAHHIFQESKQGRAQGVNTISVNSILGWTTELMRWL